MKVTAVLGQTAVNSDEKGMLTIEGMQSPRGGLKRWREIGPMVYRETDGPEVIAFRRNANGLVTDLLPAMPIQLAQRVTGLANKKVLVPILAVSGAVIVLTLLLWPIAAIVRRHYGRPLFRSGTDRLLYVASRFVCLLQVVFVILILFPLSMADKNIAFLGDGLDPWLRTAHVLGWIAAAGLIVIGFAAIKSWRTPGLGWWARVHATLLLLASAVFISFAAWTHLLSPSLRF